MVPWTLRSQLLIVAKWQLHSIGQLYVVTSTGVLTLNHIFLTTLLILKLHCVVLHLSRYMCEENYETFLMEKELTYVRNIL